MKAFTIFNLEQIVGIWKPIEDFRELFALRLTERNKDLKWVQKVYF